MNSVLGCTFVKQSPMISARSRHRWEDTTLKVLGEEKLSPVFITSALLPNWILRKDSLLWKPDGGKHILVSINHPQFEYLGKVMKT